MVAVLKVKQLKQNSNLELLENLIKKQAEHKSGDFAIGEKVSFPKFEITQSIWCLILRHNDKKLRKALLKLALVSCDADLKNLYRDENYKLIIKWYINQKLITKHKNSKFSLNPSAKTILIEILLKSNSLDSLFAKKINQKSQKTNAQLSNYAQERWESILNFIVSQNPEASVKNIGKNLAETLFYANLVKTTHSLENGFSIMPDGFRFLLMPIEKQIWTFIIHYCSSSANRNDIDLPPIQVFDFICQLAMLEPFNAYSCQDFLPAQSAILQNLREMGFVFIRKRSDAYFIMTNLLSMIANFVSISNTCDYLSSNDSLNILSQISSGKSMTEFMSSEQNYIVVESNMRLYAYSNSFLKLALISLFTKVENQFPNMISGHLTKESIQAAIRVGVEASEIIQFLENHIHPVIMTNGVKKKNDILRFLPSNVAEQILIWEAEDQNFTYENVAIYNDFEEGQFEALKEYCETNNYLVFADDVSETLYVKKHAHDLVKEFIPKIS